MCTNNTSFEHVLHNLQERDAIIDDSKRLLDQIFAHVKTNGECYKPVVRSAITGIAKRIDTIHDSYKQTIERFNIGIVAFVSDYYSIVDRHSDQFHPKYLHLYSGQKTHYNAILTTDSPATSFDVEELIDIFKEHCHELQHFKFHSDSSRLRRSRELTWAVYQKLSNFIASENVYDLADLVIRETNLIITSLDKYVIAPKSEEPGMDSGNQFNEKGCNDLFNENRNGDFNEKSRTDHLNENGNDLFNNKKSLTDHSNDKESRHLDGHGYEELSNCIKSNIQKFNNIKLEFKPSEEMLDYCECGNTMQIMAGSSEMVCDHCGYTYELKGTVFDDNQFYAQDGTRYKHAGYEPSKHCKAWLERIQARETNTITETQIARIEACIKRDGISNKKRITIEQLRRYLKDTGLTELNEHVALIKRLITGVAPPQLSYSEIQDITNAFSKAVKAYNIIRPSNKSNLLFYPFLITKLVEMHVMDFHKRKSLLSFVHLQGTQTLIQNDQIWSAICKAVPGFTYRPTDRYEYID